MWAAQSIIPIRLENENLRSLLAYIHCFSDKL